MTDAEIEKQVIEFRLCLGGLVDELSSGERPAYERVRGLTDELVCLLEEAPARKRAKIRYLLEHYEALLSSLVN